MERLATEIYGELHRLAGAVMAGQFGNPTIQPTMLVHELYLQLAGLRNIDWQSRAQFMNVAARMIRNILVDHARKRRAKKRGGTALPSLPLIGYIRTRHCK